MRVILRSLSLSYFLTVGVCVYISTHFFALGCIDDEFLCFPLTFMGHAVPFLRLFPIQFVVPKDGRMKDAA